MYGTSHRADRASFLDWYREGIFSNTVKRHHIFERSAITLIDAFHGSGDVSAPAVDDIYIGVMQSSPIKVRCNIGAGFFSDSLVPGSFFVGPPLYATQVKVSGPHFIRFLTIPVKLAQQLDTASGDRDYRTLHSKFTKDAWLSATVNQMWLDSINTDTMSQLFAETCVAAILVRLQQLSSISPKLIIKGGLSPHQQKNAVEYIENDLYRDISIVELAAQADLSPWHFCRAFKQSVGLPPHKFQTKLRINRALELLKHTKLNVLEVAVCVGYKSSKSFSQAFFRTVGCSPSAYRSNMNAGS